MKFVFLITFCTTLVLALARLEVVNDVATRGPSESLAELLENLKTQMPCGFPDLGVPPLAPFKSDYLEYTYDHSILQFLASLANLRIDGLNNFDVNEISFNILSLKASFDINFNEIHASDAQYLVQAVIAKFIRMSGNGNLEFKLQNLRLQGNLKFGVAAEGASLKEFSITIGLGGVKSNLSGLLGGGLPGRFANKLIETFLVFFVKDQAEFVSQQVHDIVVPNVNEFLSGIPMKDLIDMILNPKEPVPCIPSAFKHFFLQ